jgi:hypothetical protein
MVDRTPRLPRLSGTEPESNHAERNATEGRHESAHHSIYLL